VTNKTKFDNFKIYFLFRQKSRIAILFSDLKDYIIDNNKLSLDKLLNVYESLGFLINVWEGKIEHEYELLSKSGTNSSKLFCYKVFFEYCGLYLTFNEAYLEFLKKHFKKFDLNEKQYRLDIIQKDTSFDIKNESSELMTRQEVADFLKISYRHVINLEEAGHFERCSTIGARTPRFQRSHIEQYAIKTKTNQQK
jgi:hypothetical protein